MDDGCRRSDGVERNETLARSIDGVERSRELRIAVDPYTTHNPWVGNWGWEEWKGIENRCRWSSVIVTVVGCDGGDGTVRSGSVAGVMVDGVGN